MLSLTTTRRLVLTSLVFLLWTPAAYAWTWPVQGPVVQPFAYDEAHPYAAGQHRGIDIGADEGEQVAAPAPGKVSYAGAVPSSGESVTIETSDGYSVTLTHLGSLLVSRGASVAEGDVVGTIGPSGTPEVDGPYLHLGIRKTSDPNGYLDPLGFLPPPTPTTPATQTTPPVEQQSTTTASAVSTATAQPMASSSSPEPAATPASAPQTTTRGANVRTTRSSSRGRSSGGTLHEVRRPGSVRSAVPHPASAQAPAQLPVATPHSRSDVPASSSRRPVVEVAATLARVRLDAGHELRSTGRRAKARLRQPDRPPALPPLALNGAVALVALGAAFAAGRSTRRRRTRTDSAAQVVCIPTPSVERSPARRAA